MRKIKWFTVSNYLPEFIKKSAPNFGRIECETKERSTKINHP